MTSRSTKLPPELRPDCNSCIGLCCVAPSFDTVQGFGYNKPAHIPCVNLRPDFRCAIHDNLSAHGFPGCITFDCYGAGQRVTQEIFEGATWRDSAQVAEKMFAIFMRMCVLHELMALLTIAQGHVMEKDFQTRLACRLKEIEVLCQEEAMGPGKVDVTVIKRRTTELLRELKSTPAVAAMKPSVF